MRYEPYSIERSWTRFLRAPLPAEHAVQLYGDVDELAEPVVAYLAAGFELSEPAVVVATAEHRLLFTQRLAALGWNEDELLERGLVALMDAEETLNALLVDDGRPSPERFESIIGVVLDELAARFPGRRVRAFGEMVDLLCARGERQVAAELEDLWNLVVERRPFSLLCAYSVDLFDVDAQLSLLPQICGAHTHVHPGGDPARLGRAVGGALEGELGADAGTVYGEMPTSLGRSRLVPAAERALMWISANMPSRAERILAAARVLYATPD
jgi:hypothetical protein